MRKDISAFRHTQYAVYVVVIFAFLCVLIDSAQGVVERFNLNRRWYYLFGATCTFAYLYVRPQIRIRLGSASRAQINWSTLYIAWLCSAVFYHLPSLDSLGIDLRGDLSILLITFLLSVVTLGVAAALHAAALALGWIHPWLAHSSTASVVVLHAMNLALACSTYHSFCETGAPRRPRPDAAPASAASWAAAALRRVLTFSSADKSPWRRAVCERWLAPVPVDAFPAFGAWVIYADDSSGPQTVSPIFTLWLTIAAMLGVTCLADYSASALVHQAATEARLKEAAASEIRRASRRVRRRSAGSTYDLLANKKGADENGMMPARSSFDVLMRTMSSVGNLWSPRKLRAASSLLLFRDDFGLDFGRGWGGTGTSGEASPKTPDALARARRGARPRRRRTPRRRARDGAPQDGDGFTFEHLADRGELWFDFCADTGDGGDSTYAVARCLAAPSVTDERAEPGAAGRPLSEDERRLARALDVRGRPAGDGDEAAAGARRQKARLRTLPRGKLLLHGGDLAYPNPTEETYRTRLFSVYEAALPPPHHARRGTLVASKPDVGRGLSVPPPRCLPGCPRRGEAPDATGGSAGSLASAAHAPGACGLCRKAAALRRYEGPSAFAIPGNHDWIDGLETFSRHVLHRGWLGGWLLPQEKSYWALRLPCGWWALGLDLALVDDIDTAQYGYFARVAEARMGPDDRAILIMHCPRWLVDWFWGTTSAANLRQLIRGPLRGRARVAVAGDLHFYMRHSFHAYDAASPAASVAGTPAGASPRAAPRPAPAARPRRCRRRTPPAGMRARRGGGGGGSAASLGPGLPHANGSALGSSSSLRKRADAATSRAMDRSTDASGRPAAASQSNGVEAQTAGSSPRPARSAFQEQMQARLELGRSSSASALHDGLAAATPFAAAPPPALDETDSSAATTTQDLGPLPALTPILTGPRGNSAALNSDDEGQAGAAARFWRTAPRPAGARAPAGRRRTRAAAPTPRASWAGRRGAGRGAAPAPGWRLTDPEHLIVSGSGGAFAPDARGLAASRPRSEGEAIPDPPIGEYRCEAAFPAAATSLELGKRNLHMFRNMNSRFDIIGGALYYLLVVSVIPRCGRMSRVVEAPSLAEGALLLWEALWGTVAEIVLESYVSLAALLVLLALALGFAGTGGVGARGDVTPADRQKPELQGSGLAVRARVGGFSTRIAFAGLHVVAHVVAAVSLLLLLELGIETVIRHEHLGREGYHSLYKWYRAYEAQHFPDPFGVRALAERLTLGLYPELIRWSMAAYDIPEAIAVARGQLCETGPALTRLQALGFYGGMLAYYWLLATPTVALLFGAYLYVCVNWFGVHYDEAFSSLQVPDHKGFLRLHITRAGDLEVFSLGLDAVPGAWREDPAWREAGGARRRRRRRRVEGAHALALGPRRAARRLPRAWPRARAPAARRRLPVCAPAARTHVMMRRGDCDSLVHRCLDHVPTMYGCDDYPLRKYAMLRGSQRSGAVFCIFCCLSSSCRSSPTTRDQRHVTMAMRIAMAEESLVDICTHHMVWWAGILNTCRDLGSS
ncbi:hypothetical protein QBZ16_002204 [Prototheca wickerhamii]|uniref:Calcineurin-like phosphoesterase domain-containing protein n=1 Tax=Prototheca wickerhamii TaxID=3111 RepID=A0AAD9IMB1_PROWI|nr:hypothetical protein QBZ16_002204 [Prototheca wickerhamii]